MSLTNEFVLAIFRGAAVAVLSLVATLPVRALLLSLRPRAWVRKMGFSPTAYPGLPVPSRQFILPAGGTRLRSLAWVLLLVPYLTPVLLVGYAYYNFSLSLVHYPFANEVLYCVLMAVKLVPVAVLVLYFYPSTLSPQALHCRRLLQARRRRVARFLSDLAFRIRASAAAGSIAFALVFLFAFGEFEFASLLAVKTWTVKLFDAQAGGLLLSESLRLAVLPVAFEGALLAVVLVVLYRSRRLPSTPVRAVAGVEKKVVRAAAWAYLCAAAVAVAVLPAVLVLRGTPAGFAALARNFALGKDIGASILFGLGAAAIAYLAIGWFSGHLASGGKVKLSLLGAFFLSVPGLLGALLLSLLIVVLFQLPGLRAGYDTPIPLLAALSLLLFPFAVLLRLLLHALRPGRQLHVARLLGKSSDSSSRRQARKLVWEMKNRGRFWVAFLLFCWAYFDLTASSLLSPSSMTPVFVRLYNLMHYGQSAVLSAMVCVSFAVPLILLLVTGGARRILLRLYSHG